MRVKETAGIEIRPEPEWGSKWQSDEPETGEEVKEGVENVKIAEALIIPQSDLISRTLKSSNFFQQYNLTVLAIHRHGHSLFSGSLGVSRLVSPTR